MMMELLVYVLVGYHVSNGLDYPERCFFMLVWPYGVIKNSIKAIREGYLKRLWTGAPKE